jgi:hypothetical protein
MYGRRNARGSEAAAGGGFVRDNDRRIVTRLASTRALIGQATVQMVGDKGADGQLQPARLRELARPLTNVSRELDARADEISGTAANVASCGVAAQRAPEAVML